jgi:hypothetical protein
MNRRSFLQGIGAIIGGVAIDKAIPLGRVWSFPKEIKCLNLAKSASTFAVPFITAPGLRPGDVIDIFASDFSIKRATATVIATMGSEVFLDKEIPEASPGDIVSLKRDMPRATYAPLPAFVNLARSTQRPEAIAAVAV